ncbi:erythrocyte membrane protein 1, PfEMP1, putative [Plasmodium sp. DRC-Itaito]|nr:erythrocyte membrane protein 1, PfEMP1, putative [Plasmodium sp. DRC-Itaito]
MAPSGGGSSQDAKYVLDELGKIVYEEVKREALTRSNGELKGSLSLATTNGETVSSDKPCELEYDKLAGGGTSVDPCGTGTETDKRFSEERIVEYDEKKIRDHKDKSAGEYVPYRRLYLCNKNLQQIKTGNITKHDLLAGVCYAAKYEGESIIEHYPQYGAQYPGSKYEMCTALARSFADIGDIIRGKDMFEGKNKRGKILQEKLEGIFRKIYEELIKDSRNAEFKTHYEQDGPKYYKLREDWWEANRGTIWQAITCGADTGNAYFRPTCDKGDEKGPEQAHDKCRCGRKNNGKPNPDPPTFFDYVPQYLRWFEEWTEDFCRRKKKKLQDLEKECRDYKTKKYCSGNGYDCTKTVYKKGKIIIGYQCTKCSVLCRLYEKWIDNEKKEFIKQSEKYTKEILDTGRSQRGIRNNNNYEEYGKKFYEIFKRTYKEDDAFLKLLNNEDVCKSIENEKEQVNFTKNDDNVFHKNINNVGTFYHSEYCEVCPGCGMRRKRNVEEWEEKEGGNCNANKHYTITNETKGKEIKVLSFGDKHEDIIKNMNKFCDENGPKDELMEKWKCYEALYVHEDRRKDVEDEDEDDDGKEEVKGAGGICILKKDREKEKEKEKRKKSEDEPDELQKTFNDFFYFWIERFLNDSIEWRNKVRRCLNRKSQICKSRCKEDCACFAKWVEQKEKEWESIKEHFRTQEGFDKEGGQNNIEFLGGGMTYDVVLNYILDLKELLEIIQDAYGKSKKTDHIRNILKEEEERQEEDAAAEPDAADTEKKITFDKLLNHEEQDAQKCQKCEEEPPKSTGRDDGGARSLTTPRQVETERGDLEEEEEDEDEEEEENNGEGDGEAESSTTETTGVVEVPLPPKEEDPKICDIVKDALTGSLTKACEQKYNLPHRYWGWKCVTPSGKPNSDTTERSRGKRSVAAPSSDGKTTGSMCVPPRRRKLYIDKILEWANTSGSNEVASGTEVGANKAEGPSPEGTTKAASSLSDMPDPKTKLLEAFVQSAAVETYFLWDRYNKIKKKEIEAKDRERNGGLPTGLASSGIEVLGGESDENKTPEQHLLDGTIPDDFLRQMFYTLGDYKDIFCGVKEDVREALKKSVVKTTPSGTEESGNKEAQSSGDTWDEIQSKIDAHIKTYNPSETSAPSREPSSPSENLDPNSVKRKTWWEQYAPQIWHGMVCALTYETKKENGDGEKDTYKIEKNEQVYKKFFGDTTSEKALGKTLSDGGTYKTQYNYTDVTIGANETEEMAPNAGKDDHHGTKLSEFVKTPTFFRWLHEWGTNFCVMRKKMLVKIREGCKVGNNGRGRDKGEQPQCSCYGEKCDDQLRNHKYDNVPSLLCKDCGKYCRFYRRWIAKKQDEYDKQKGIYGEQKKKCAPNGNGFCATVNKCTDAKAFLQKLATCSKTDNEPIKGVDTSYFEDNSIFKPASNCKACSAFKIDCAKANCNDDGINGKCNDKGTANITSEDIGINGNSTSALNMRVSDKSGGGFENGLDACKKAGIFEGIKEKKYKCRNVCGYVVCKPQNGNGETPNGNNQIISIIAIAKYWLQQFFEDYNKIRKKLNSCTNNVEGNACKNKCETKCTCAKAWIEKKIDEWKGIKERLNEQYKSADEDLKSSLKDFMKELISQTSLTLDKREQIGLGKLFQCNCDNGSVNSSGKDPVQCFLDALQKKIETCESPPGDTACTSSTETLPDDEEEEDPSLEIPEDQKLDTPKICPNDPESAKEKEEDMCEAPPVAPVLEDPDVPVEDTSVNGGADDRENNEIAEVKDVKDDQADQDTTDKGDAELPSPSHEKTSAKAGSEKKVQQKPKSRQNKRHVIPQPPPVDKTPSLVTTTLAWSVGIGFTALSYWWLLKRKPKPPVKLFRVLDIPKGDYGMPTLKSSNRYIPYSSGKHRGKRYIYIEGDNETDSGYTDHYSDITSSSESEYDEIDMYIPHVPKYKTFIEVVLEPSKRDIQNDVPSVGPTHGPISDEEWNELKENFISLYLQNEQKDMPNISGDNSDNNTHLNTLHDNVDQKPFIMSIHDRNLYTGEEYSYDMFNSGIYGSSSNPSSYSDNPSSYSDNPRSYSDNPSSYSGNVGPYSGIDLINDSLGGNHDIYDEILKRKENELFGTEHPKHTNTHNVAQPARDDPLYNQINLFHKWLDRHRNMCEKWENNHERLDKLKEEWENDTYSGKLSDNTPPTTNNKPSGKLSDIPSGNHVLNTDVSIKIDMDTIHVENPNPMDQKPLLVENNIYVDSNTPNSNHQNPVDTPTHVQIEMSVNNGEMVKEKYPIGDI